ncbi:MAG TPA: mannonate dehydratase [Terriglobia bacterium]|nr:mannonate dehydratase [Terriglobia bacterium]
MAPHKANHTRKARREGNFDPGRRRFAQWALAGTLGAAALNSRPLPAAPMLHDIPPGIKIAVQLGADPSDEDLQFVNQLGVDYVTIWLHADLATYENFTRLRRKVEGAGLKVWNIGNLNVHNMEEVTLNLPGREQKIEEYKTYLRTLGKAGIYYTTFAFMGNGIWSSARETTRGGASARAFDLAKDPAGYWDQKVFHGPLTHGRVYSEQEIWDNYTYFIKAVVPVAEEAGVRIGIHPDDPPMPVLGGIPRCIFGNFDGYQRALEIANSPNIGMCLCCGTWLEGGRYTRKSLLETIQYFGSRGKIFKIHFRNVNAPLPHFVETFIDDGYMDMYQVMRALREVNFNGVMIPDHIPGMIGDRAGTAYSVAYMKAYQQRANEEAAG